MAKKYRSRIADALLENKLKTIGAVLIELQSNTQVVWSI